VRVTFDPPRRQYPPGTRPPIPRPQFPTWGRKFLIIAAAIVVLIVVVGVFVSINTELLWFHSVGYTKVFTTVLWTRVLMFIGFGLFMVLATGGNMYLAFRIRPSFRASSPEQLVLDNYRTALEKRMRWLIGVVSAFFGLIFGLAASGKWRTWLLWSHSTSFGHKDPEFHRDVSYYAFIYPFERFILGYLMALVVIVTIVTLLMHYVFGGIAFRTPGQRLTKAARAHLASLLTLFVIGKAVAYYLDRFGLAFSERGVVTGPSYTDVNAVLPAKAILAIIALFCAALFIASIFRTGWVLPVVSFALLVLSAVIIGGIYPLIVQNFSVKPSEQTKEAPYIERNIQQTRYAYNLTSVTPTPYNATTTVKSAADLTSSTATGAGVRLLDNSVLPATYNQLQQFRNFYSVSNLDIDRYIINDQEQDTVVAVRELDLSGVPASQKSWINEHLVYTHGYGFVAAPGNAVDSDGRPGFVEDNIPSQGSLGNFQPRIYFGQGETSFSVVGSPKGASPREYDYPTNSGDGQQYTTYTGGGGVAIGSTFRQLEYALRFGDKNLLLSDGLNADSRILYDRDPRQRVAKVAPYLTLDGDPYAAIVDGKLVWIVDGYTTSDGFPYSERENLNSITEDSNTAAARTSAQASTDINYIRNSVKATVDAYSGAVTLYDWDPTDPVLKTWMKVFPGTVKPESQMSAQLIAHVRYPEDIFKVQRKVLATYHVTDPSAFYQQQDFWQVPADPTSSETNQPAQPPYYLTLKMPDQSKPTFSLTTTFVPRQRPNLSAFMAVDSDPGPDYGHIRVLQLPRSSTISGPGQVQNQFESDPNVQVTLNLLRTQGGAAKVVYGNLLTLPVGGGLLYVEPVYVEANNGEAYPLLQKVLVAFGDEIGFQDTYSQAVAALATGSQGSGTASSGGTSPSGSASPPASSATSPSSVPTASPSVNDSIAQLVRAAQQAYAAGQAALAKGDFATYGEDQKQLASDLASAAALAGVSTPSATPSASPSASPSSPPATAPTPSGSG
jgi:uncharacterized membrane protein (UPF0182 family)